MAVDKFHGIVHTEVKGNPPPITISGGATIGIVGTYEGTATTETIFHFKNEAEAAKELLGDKNTVLDGDFLKKTDPKRDSLLKSLAVIFAHCNCDVVCVKVEHESQGGNSGPQTNQPSYDTLIDFPDAQGLKFAPVPESKLTAVALHEEAGKKGLKATFDGLGATDALIGKMDYSPASPVDLSGAGTIKLSYKNMTDGDIRFDFYITTSAGEFKSTPQTVTKTPDAHEIVFNLKDKTWIKVNAGARATPNVAIDGINGVIKYGFVFKATSGTRAGDLIFWEIQKAAPVSTSSSAATTDASAVSVEAAKVKAAIGRLKEAQTMFGITPKLIGAPSLIADKDVAKSLQDVGDGLTAVCFYDLASTTVEAAINEAKNSGLSDRSVACWPAGCIDKDRKIKLGLSAWALARYAKTDIETGWHVSGSNKKLFKLWGLEHPIGWAVTDKSSEAARLNNANIVTAINYEGWRLWGNRSVATGDGDRGFIAVRRTADFIGEAIIKAHIDLLDSPINRSFVGLVLSRCNSLMRDLKNQEKILGGEVWIDPERNSTDSVRTGKLVYQYRFTPNYPCEELTFEQSITYEWISEIFK